MLTQGPTPDPKCKLSISTFLTLPHLLDCLICTRNSDVDQGVGVGNGMSIISEFVFFLLVLLSFVFSCLLSLFLGL